MLEEERKMILQMLADGKITAEQATELLRALGDSTADSGAGQAPDITGAVRDAARSVTDEVREAADNASEDAREAARQAREQARDAARTARDAFRDGKDRAKAEARKLRDEIRQSGLGSDLGGVGAFIENLVTRITSEFGAGHYRWEETYTGQFDTGAIQLSLDTGNGSINCCTWDEPGYKLVLRVSASGANEEEARKRAQSHIKLEHGSTGVELRVDSWHATSVSAHLYLPAGPEYSLKAHSGNGSLDLGGCTLASARVRTGNGSIDLSGAVGELDASTGNGSIRAVAAGSGSMVLATGNGSITVDTASLPSDVGVDVNATSGLGRIRVELPGGRGVSQVGMTTVQLSSRDEAVKRLSIRARSGLGSVTIG